MTTAPQRGNDVTFVLVAALIILNVLIGVVLHSMEEAREITRRKKLPTLRPAALPG